MGSVFLLENLKSNKFSHTNYYPRNKGEHEFPFFLINRYQSSSLSNSGFFDDETVQATDDSRFSEGSNGVVRVQDLYIYLYIPGKDLHGLGPRLDSFLESKLSVVHNLDLYK